MWLEISTDVEFVLYIVVKVPLISYKKTDMQLLLKNQKTWQNGPEFLSRGHLGENLLPLDQESSLARITVPTTLYCLSPGPLAWTQNACIFLAMGGGWWGPWLIKQHVVSC